ncbi:speriolin-like protein [Discoglossus pictus]
MELLNSHDIGPIQNENDRLLMENGELRKLVGLMQENLELRTILEKTSHQIEENPAPGAKAVKSKGEECAKEGSDKKECEKKEDEAEGAMHPPQNSHQLHRMQRIVGEIAFQLDRRILAYIFQDRVRLYGITVSNIPQKIAEAVQDRQTGQEDTKKKDEMNKRYEEVLEKLKANGYDPQIHPAFSEYIVNVYGIIKEYPPPGSPDMKNICDPDNLKKIANSTVPSDDLKDVLILLKCLSNLSRDDGKPVFVW